MIEGVTMPAKRKDHPLVEASPAKRPARRGDEEEEEEVQDMPWGRKPGMILEVAMRNFMCHQVGF